MQLMRDRLKQIFPKVNDAHAGLLMQRGLTHWEQSEKSIKSDLINIITKVTPNELYLLAFDRWLDATHEAGNDNFASLSATIEGRLLTGLPLGGTLETGASTHHTYGMPMLPGSSIKGAVKSYTEHLFAERDETGAIQFIKNGNSHKIVIQNDKQQILDVLFGADNDDVDQANAGYLVWHDAWWIPIVDDHRNLKTGSAYKPFIDDIVTVHHPEYYSQNLDEALNMENPVPNQQMAIQGSFYFAIEGEQKWVILAKELLQRTIENIGLGSKGSSGYGYFVLNNDLSNDIAKRFEMGRPIDTSTDPLGAIRQVIKYLDESVLIDSLSKGKNAFFGDLGLDKDNDDDVQKVVQVVLEEFSELVDSWSDAQKKSNTEKAYKFVKKARS